MNLPKSAKRASSMKAGEKDPCPPALAKRASIPGASSSSSSASRSAETCQVWPIKLRFFFRLLSFLLKIIDLPRGQIIEPLLEKSYSLLFHPATPRSPSRTLEGLIGLTKRLQGPSPVALFAELKKQKDTFI